MDDVNSLIRRRYEIELKLFDLHNELNSLEEKFPVALYELRYTKAAYEEYIAGTFPSFFDKLAGKYDDKKDKLYHAFCLAQASHDACKGQLDMCRTNIASIESDSVILPSRETLFSIYPNNDYLKYCDAHYCIKCALALLEQNHVYLSSARDWTENKYADFKPLGTQYEKSQALKLGSECATQICILLKQIVSNGFHLEIHPYFQNPSGFIAAVARQYGQQDRINYAINAVRTTTTTLKQLMNSLVDDNFSI